MLKVISMNMVARRDVVVSEQEKMEKFWEDKASKVFEGRTIAKARYMTDEERHEMGWRNRTVVFELDNGTVMFPSMDDEGNDGGSMFGIAVDGSNVDMPVLRW
jgi:hypothetical protein